MAIPPVLLRKHLLSMVPSDVPTEMIALIVDYACQCALLVRARNCRSSWNTELSHTIDSGLCDLLPNQRQRSLLPIPWELVYYVQTNAVCKDMTYLPDGLRVIIDTWNNIRIHDNGTYLPVPAGIKWQSLAVFGRVLCALSTDGAIWEWECDRPYRSLGPMWKIPNEKIKELISLTDHLFAWTVTRQLYMLQGKKSQWQEILLPDGLKPHYHYHYYGLHCSLASSRDQQCLLLNPKDSLHCPHAFNPVTNSWSSRPQYHRIDHSPSVDDGVSAVVWIERARWLYL